jgi:hypothetical protein
MPVERKRSALGGDHPARSSRNATISCFRFARRTPPQGPSFVRSPILVLSVSDRVAFSQANTRLCIKGRPRSPFSAVDDDLPQPGVSVYHRFAHVLRPLIDPWEILPIVGQPTISDPCHHSRTPSVPPDSGPHHPYPPKKKKKKKLPLRVSLVEWSRMARSWGPPPGTCTPGPPAASCGRDVLITPLG